MSVETNRAEANRLAPAMQLKLSLRGVSKPAVWRRLLVPTDIRLDRLHDVIQTSMGWTDTHRHVFSTAAGDYGIPDPELGFQNERTARLVHFSNSRATASTTPTTSATAGSTTSLSRRNSTPSQANRFQFALQERAPAPGRLRRTLGVHRSKGRSREPTSRRPREHARLARPQQLSIHSTDDYTREILLPTARERVFSRPDHDQRPRGLVDAARERQRKRGRRARGRLRRPRREDRVRLRPAGNPWARDGTLLSGRPGHASVSARGGKRPGLCRSSQLCTWTPQDRDRSAARAGTAGSPCARR